MLEEEIQTTKQAMLAEKSEYPAFSPYFSGRALNLSIKSSRLQWLAETLRTSTWQRADGADGLHADAFHHGDSLVQSIRARVADLYRKWLAELGDNPQSRLDRYLMRRGGCPDDKAGSSSASLACNADPRLVALCEEAAYWLDLRFELPANLQLINGRWKSLQFVYENVLAIVGAYNKIVQGILRRLCLSPQEVRCLETTLVGQCALYIATEAHERDYPTMQTRSLGGHAAFPSYIHQAQAHCLAILPTMRKDFDLLNWTCILIKTIKSFY